MDRLRVSSEFVFVIWIFVIRICFVLRASDFGFKSLRQKSCPLIRGFPRPPAQRKKRSLHPPQLQFGRGCSLLSVPANLSGPAVITKIVPRIKLRVFRQFWSSLKIFRVQHVLAGSRSKYRHKTLSALNQNQLDII